MLEVDHWPHKSEEGVLERDSISVKQRWENICSEIHDGRIFDFLPFGKSRQFCPF